MDALKPYLKLIEYGAIAVLCVWLYLHIYHAGEDANEAKHAKADALAAQIHQQELDKAGHAHDAEIADLSRYISDHPLSVRLCPAPVQAPTTASASPSPSGGDVQPVPSGNSSPGAGIDTDIGALLSALAASADSVSADLRAQQAVK
jgi:hypothetical protein